MAPAVGSVRTATGIHCRVQFTDGPRKKRTGKHRKLLYIIRENMIPIGDLKQFSEPNPAFRVLKPWWDVLAEYTNIIMAMLSLFTASLQILPRFATVPECAVWSPFRCVRIDENGGTATTHLVEWDALKPMIYGHCVHAMVALRDTLSRELAQMATFLGGLERATLEDAFTRHELTEKRDNYVCLLESLRCIDYSVYQAKMHTEGDNSGRLLVWLMRHVTDNTQLTVIQVSLGPFP
ncbi:hypothetical protein NDU88_004780 [Pleurodeles waltl]|uniref:LRRC8 pannexin-like TM region domain-containing protein n=1 Tax=Pleurodeles waltl TaxID=8319 RepID=A0AAV7T8Q5_PLEWA|nr:hypothetical protein NDU88_004780 [Pleurodeles waltl]